MDRETMERIRLPRGIPALFHGALLLVFFAVAGCSSSSDSTPSDPGDPGDGEVITPPGGDELADDSTIQVEVNALGTASPLTLSLAEGDTASIALAPDAGNELVSITGCQGVLSGNDYEVSWQQDDCSIHVEFGPIGAQLTIDVFGDGVVQSESGTLCGARETCEVRFPENVPVRLTPVASSGWSFNHWTGCDTLEGDVCIVEMDGAEGVLPSFANDDGITLNADVILLTDSQIAAIEEIDDASIVFRSDVEGVDTFTVDKILVSTSGNGFARRISRVIAISQTPVLVQTREVPISDLIDDGTLVWQGDSTDGADLEFIPAEGVTVVDSENKSLNSSIQLQTVVYDNDGNLATQNDQVTLAIGLQSQFTPDFGFEKRFGRDVAIRFVAGAKVTASAVLGYQIALPGVIPMKLGTFRAPPIPIGPIVLVPQYEVFTDIGGSVDTSVSVSTTFSLGGSLGVYKKSGESWKGLNAMSADGQAPVLDKTQVNVNAGIWAGVDSEFLVYGVAGPFIKAGPESGYKRSYSVEGSDAGCFTESAYFGAKATLGGRIDLVLWEATLPSRSLSIRPVELSWMQDQGVQCNTGIYGAPQNLVTTLDQNNEILASWEPPVGEPLVKYSVFRDNVLLATVWDLEYLDGGVSDNVEHCYHVVGFDAHGRSSVNSASSCTATGSTIDTAAPSAPTGLSILDSSTATLELTWNASVDESGVAAYLVQQGSRVIERSDDVVARVTQLLPGTEYCFSVIAVDLAGNRSPESETLCGRTLPEDAGLWRMRIACVGREYVLENQVDLQSTQQGVVNFAGEGLDYPGTPIAYIVSGVYSGDSGVLDGRITYTFANDDNVRIDLFSADLSTGDSGDVAMDQIQVTGCNTIVRFDLLDSELTKRPAEEGRSTLLPAMALNDSRGIAH